MTTSLKSMVFSLLFLGLILHYVVPGTQEVWAELPLLLAVLLHGASLLGRWQIVVYVIIGMIIGSLAEFIGINTFLVFGAYHYNPLENNEMIYGLPLTIPVMYPVIAYAINFMCVSFSKKLVFKKNVWLLGMLTGSIAMTKDLVTDPLQSTVAHIWIWNNGGAYFGVPVHNFIGWFCVFLLITVVAVLLTWNSNKLYEKIKQDKNLLAFPLILFFVILLFGITSAITASAQWPDLAHVSLLIALFVLMPYIILSGFKVFKR